MKSVQRGYTNKILNVVLYCILILAFYKVTMEKAVENYMKSSTTIVQRQENTTKPVPPVFMICPDPPFKTSFFTDFGMKNTMGAEKYFWIQPMVITMFTKNSSFTAMDLYMKMSYQMGKDINVSIFQFFE